MASPKSGTTCETETPESVPEAVDADVADPGMAAEAKGTSTSEEQSTMEGSESSEDDSESEESEKNTEKAHWIGIKLEDHEGKPAINARYKVKLSDGTLETGSLDKNGKVLLKPVPTGQCEISFPDIHQDEWSLK